MDLHTMLRSQRTEQRNSLQEAVRKLQKDLQAQKEICEEQKSLIQRQSDLIRKQNRLLQEYMKLLLINPAETEDAVESSGKAPSEEIQMISSPPENLPVQKTEGRRRPVRSDNPLHRLPTKHRKKSARPQKMK